MNKINIEKIKERYDKVFTYMSKAAAEQLFMIMKKNGHRDPEDTIVDEEGFVYNIIHDALNMLVDEEVWTSCGGYDIRLNIDDGKLLISIDHNLIEDELEI